MRTLCPRFPYFFNKCGLTNALWHWSGGLVRLIIAAWILPATAFADNQPGFVFAQQIPEMPARSHTNAPLTGRGVFLVTVADQAVLVEGAFLEDKGQVLKMPAVFANREYALEQIDELRQIVIKRFEELEAEKAKRIKSSVTIQPVRSGYAF